MESAKIGAWRSPARCLCAAAVLHLALSVTSYELGRHEILPFTFDAHGVAVAFASDGVRYRADAATRITELRRASRRVIT